MPINTIQTSTESLGQRLGSDVQFPINGNFETVNGLTILLQDIQILLLTIPGERVNRPDYGCALRTLIWENIDTAATQGSGAIKQALDKFEPRISVTDVSFTVNRNTGLITYRIKFFVKNTDVAANLVFPFRSSQEISSQ